MIKVPLIVQDILKSMADQSDSSITDAVTHLHNLLLTKEKELKEREADFSRRVNLFESTNPSMGSDNDIIQLNIGGRTNIAVFRNLLTQFDGSMLAAKFSGRWDDSMERDRDGNIFIDQDPDNFMILITYLRMRMNNQSKKIPYSNRPVPTYNFCTMLEYYNLMPGVYTQTWVGHPCTEDSVEIAYGTVVLTSEGENVRVLHPHQNLNIPQVTEFTVEFDKGTSGAVGWIEAEDQFGRYNQSAFTKPLDTSHSNSLYLNVTERKVFCSDFTKENLRINHNEEVTTITCQRGKSSGGGKRTFSIQIGDDERFEGELLPKGVLPMIDFSGKVTISGIKFDIDALPTGSKNLYNFEGSYS